MSESCLSCNVYNVVSCVQVDFVQLHAFDALCSLCLLDAPDPEVRLGFVHSLLRHAELSLAIPGQVCQLCYLTLTLYYLL